MDVRSVRGGKFEIDLGLLRDRFVGDENGVTSVQGWGRLTNKRRSRWRDYVKGRVDGREDEPVILDKV